MNQSSWRDVAEIIGIASIVASLVFVGLELRQSQQAAGVEASTTRAGWFFDNRNAVNDHAEVWVKGISGAALSDAESVIFANLVRNIHTNNRFTFARERNLGFSGYEYAAHELAWLLHKYPAARKEWELYVGDLDEMRDALMPRTGEGSGFIDIVKADLEKLDGTSP